MGVQITPCEGAIVGEKTCQPTCHPLQRQMHSSTTGAVVALSPTGEECTHHREERWGLVNMIQLSVCGSDVAFCQTSLTTCYFLYRERRLTRGDRTAALVLLLTLALFMLLLERVAAADAGCSFCTSSISSLTITHTALTATFRST